MEAEATRDQSHLTKLHENQTRHIEELSRKSRRCARDRPTTKSSPSPKDHAESPRGGEERPSAHAHIMHATRFVPEAETHAGRVAQLDGLDQHRPALVTLILIIAYEIAPPLRARLRHRYVRVHRGRLQRRLTRFIVSVNVALEVVGALVLLEHYFWSVIVLAVLIVGLYILWENLRELGR